MFTVGGAISPAQLLEIYEPTLLKWLYMRRPPTQSFNLAFDTEVYRQYDEFVSRRHRLMPQPQAAPSQHPLLPYEIYAYPMRATDRKSWAIRPVVTLSSSASSVGTR